MKWNNRQRLRKSISQKVKLKSLKKTVCLHQSQMIIMKVQKRQLRLNHRSKGKRINRKSKVKEVTISSRRNKKSLENLLISLELLPTLEAIWSKDNLMKTCITLSTCRKLVTYQPMNPSSIIIKNMLTRSPSKSLITLTKLKMNSLPSHQASVLLTISASKVLQFHILKNN